MLFNRPFLTVALTRLYFLDDFTFEHDIYIEVYRVVGIMCFRLSEWCLLLLLILLAKGWTIVRISLKAQTHLRLSLMMSIVLFVMITSLAHQSFVTSLGALEVYWATFLGRLILSLYFIFYFWFVKICIHTMTRFKEQRNFYAIFFLVFSLVLLSRPTLLLIMSAVISRSRLRGVLFCVEHGISLLSLIVLVMLYIPDISCNKHFPFHSMMRKMKEKNARKKLVNVAKSKVSTGKTDEHVSVRRINTVDETINNDERQKYKMAIHSNLIGLDPVERCRVLLDTLQFRMHRLNLSIASALALVTNLDKKIIVKKENKSAQHLDRSNVGDTSSFIFERNDGRPVISSASRAAKHLMKKSKNVEVTKIQNKMHSSQPQSIADTSFVSMPLRSEISK